MDADTETFLVHLGSNITMNLYIDGKVEAGCFEPGGLYILATNLSQQKDSNSSLWKKIRDTALKMLKAKRENFLEMMRVDKNGWYPVEYWDNELYILHRRMVSVEDCSGAHKTLKGIFDYRSGPIIENQPLPDVNLPINCHDLASRRWTIEEVESEKAESEKAGDGFEVITKT